MNKFYRWESCIVLLLLSWHGFGYIESLQPVSSRIISRTNINVLS